MKQVYPVLRWLMNFILSVIRSTLDDITGIITGMIMIAFGMTTIFAIVSQADQILFTLVEISVRAGAVTPEIAAGAIGAALYFFIGLTVTLIFAVNGFKASDDEALTEAIDEVNENVESVDLTETTAADLQASITLLNENLTALLLEKAA